MEKIWTRDLIHEKIMHSNAWTEHALVALYRCQTEDEQAHGETVHHNGVGFNGIDAAFATSLATQVINGRHLSDKQLAAARRILPKYCKQLAIIANETNQTKLK